MTPMDDSMLADLLWQWIGLAVLLLTSGFASMSETVMMAANRYRLKARADNGERGAQLAAALTAHPERMLSVILLVNNAVNVGAATLASVITIELFGQNETMLAVGSFVLTFLILVFSEITPKVIGARYADLLAPYIAYPLTAALRLVGPVVDFVNLFVKALLWLLRLPRRATPQAPSLEELRSIVLESRVLRSEKHRDVLLKLFDLERITVADVMIPRQAIEFLDLTDDEETLRAQLATAYHTRLPVIEGNPDEVLGILHVRQLLAETLTSGFSREAIRRSLSPPYFVPEETNAMTQLQFFQEHHQRLALVVDEYGELQGLVTLDDIIEEMVGKFTTSRPGSDTVLQWQEDGTVIIDGATPVREINRALGLDLPTDGPRTLNGLILEYLQEIPEAEVSLRIGEVRMDVLQCHDRRIRSVRLYAPTAGEGDTSENSVGEDSNEERR